MEGYQIRPAMGAAVEGRSTIDKPVIKNDRTSESALEWFVGPRGLRFWVGWLHAIRRERHAPSEAAAGRQPIQKSMVDT